MAQNGRTSFIHPDSEGAPASGSNGAAQYLDASRRRDRLVRRESARRQSLTPSLHEAENEPNFSYSAKDVELAAQTMFEALRGGRMMRTQVEQEQREDADRLAGWKAVGVPDSHTDGAELVQKYQYRMKVRNRALDLFDAFDLTNLTARTRAGRSTPSTPEWKPWRRGAEGGGKVY